MVHAGGHPAGIESLYHLWRFAVMPSVARCGAFAGQRAAIAKQCRANVQCNFPNALMAQSEGRPHLSQSRRRWDRRWPQRQSQTLHAEDARAPTAHVYASPHVCLYASRSQMAFSDLTLWR